MEVLTRMNLKVEIYVALIKHFEDEFPACAECLNADLMRSAGRHGHG